MLTTNPATYFRNCKCSGPILLVAATGDDEEQSLKEFVRIGTDELKSSPAIWLKLPAVDLPSRHHQRPQDLVGKSPCGSLRLASRALERLAEYVVRTRELI